MRSQKGWEVVQRLGWTDEVSDCKPLIQPLLEFWGIFSQLQGSWAGSPAASTGQQEWCRVLHGKSCQLMRVQHSGTFMVLVVTVRHIPSTASACSLCCSGGLLEHGDSGCVCVGLEVPDKLWGLLLRIWSQLQLFPGSAQLGLGEKIAWRMHSFLLFQTRGVCLEEDDKL